MATLKNTPLDQLKDMIGLPVQVTVKLDNNSGDVILTGNLLEVRQMFGRVDGLVELPAPNKNPRWFTHQKIKKA